MEITGVWGREIAIRSVVRRISFSGMYLGRVKTGRSYFLSMDSRGHKGIRQANESWLLVLGGRDGPNA